MSGLRKIAARIRCRLPPSATRTPISRVRRATVNAIIRRENIKEVEGAIVLDCNAVLLKVTEGMAELSRDIGLLASPRLLYQAPTRGARDEWTKIYNFRSSPRLTA